MKLPIAVALAISAGLLTCAYGQDARALLKDGEQDFHKGNYRTAEDKLRLALRAAEQRGAPPGELIRIALERARALVELGRFEDAKGLLDGLFQQLGSAADLRQSRDILIIRADANRGRWNYADAESGYGEALSLVPGKARADLPDRGRCLLGLGDLHRQKGQFKQAEAELNEALDLLDKDSPPLARLRARVQVGLGDLYRETGRWRDATQQYQVAIDGFKTDQEPLAQDPELARAETGLGLLALEAGEPALAAGLVNQAFEQCRELTSSPAYLETEDLSFRLAIDRGEPAAAIQRLSDPGRLAHLNEIHPERAASMDLLGLAFLRTKHNSEAEAFLNSSVQTWSAISNSLPGYALALRHLGMATGAEERLREALRVEEAALGGDALAAAETRCELGDLLSASRPADALPLYRQALAASWPDAPGPRTRPEAEHPVRMRALFALAGLYQRTGKLPEARKVLSEWLAIRGSAAPLNSPGRVQALTALAEVDLDAGKFNAAEQTLRGVLPLVEASGTDAARARCELAESLYGQRVRLDEAATAYEAALPQLPPSSLSARAWIHLANLYSSSDQSPKAVAGYRKGLEIVSSEDPSRQPALFALGVLLVHQTQWKDADEPFREWLDAKTKSRQALSAEEAAKVEELGSGLWGLKDPAATRYLRFEADNYRAANWRTPLDTLFVRLAEAYAAEKNAPEAARFYLAQASRDLSSYRVSQAHERSLIALKLLAQENGPDGSPLVAALELQARTAMAQRNFAEAKDALERQRAIAEKSPGTPAGLAAAWNRLGELAQRERRYEDARQFYDRAATALGAQPRPAALVCNQGLFAAETGAADDAAKLMSECATTAAQHSDPDSLGLLENAAPYFINTGQPDRAAKVYEQALGLRRDLFGASGPEQAWELEALAETALVRGSYEEAIESGARALKFFEQAAGPDSEDASSALSTLAAAYWKAGKPAKALEFLLRRITIEDKSRDSDVSRRAALLAELGALYRDQRYFADERRTYEKLCTLWPEDYGNPNYASARLNLAIAFRDSNDEDQAERMFKELMRAIKGRPVEERDALLAYSAALRRTGDPDRAEKLAREAAALQAATR